MTEGVDYAFSSPSATSLAAAGKAFAMRYVGPGSATKHLTAAERDRLWAAGLAIVLLAEGAEGDALGGSNVGAAHARSAQQAAAALGAPNLPVYFAVDFDVTTGQWSAVANYLRGAASVIGAARVGIYGSVRAIQWAARDKVAAWFFQTYAWSAGQWYAGNHVEQYRNNQSLAGGTVDLCRAKVANYGQWTRGSVAATGDDDMTPDQAATLKHIDEVLTYNTNPWTGSSLQAIGRVEQLLTTVAQRSGISDEELAQIKQAAAAGVAEQTDALVQAVLAKLPAAGVGLSHDDVEQAVRDAFAGGLAPEK